MANGATLLDLPAEIIAKILNYIDPVEAKVYNLNRYLETITRSLKTCCVRGKLDPISLSRELPNLKELHLNDCRMEINNLDDLLTLLPSVRKIVGRAYMTCPRMYQMDSFENLEAIFKSRPDIILRFRYRLGKDWWLIRDPSTFLSTIMAAKP